MAEESKSENIAQTIIGSSYAVLEAFFRHALNGLFLIPLWFYSSPSKFEHVEVQHLSVYLMILIGVAAMVLGNVWYATHRFTVHTVVDMISRCCNKCMDSCKYAHWLAAHLRRSSESSLKEFKSYLKYRSSMINLLYIACEGLFVFAIYAEENTLIHTNKCCLIWLSVIVFLFAVWQHILMFYVDDKITRALSREKTDSEITSSSLTVITHTQETSH